jgi:hypothetical protein
MRKLKNNYDAEKQEKGSNGYKIRIASGAATLPMSYSRPPA